MLEYVGEAVSILDGRSFAQLSSDRTAQLALARCLEIFGEAMNRIPAHVRESYPDLPWKEAISTRNRLIHGYDVVRLDILHEIVSEELPPLIPRLREIVEGLRRN